MMNECDRILSHMERFFGSCVGSPRTVADAGVRFVERLGLRRRDVVTWSTWGMSDTPLTQRRSGRMVKLELVFACDARYACDEIPMAMSLVSEESVRSGIAPDMFTLWPMPAFPGTAFVSLLLYPPCLWDDASAQVEGTSVPTLVGYLMPLSLTETRLVGEEGVAALEDYLEGEQVDVLDLARP